MKFVYGVLVAMLTFGGVSPVFAQQMGGIRLQPPSEPLYFGLKAGAMDVDDTADSANNIGVMAGYKFHEDERGAFFGEAEYTRSFSDGDAGAGVGDYDVETLSGFAGFRSAGNIFWKAKAGFTWWDVSVEGASPAEDDGTSLSFGVGGGWRLDQSTGIEAEYTILDSDIDFFSIGVFTTF